MDHLVGSIAYGGEMTGDSSERAEQSPPDIVGEMNASVRKQMRKYNLARYVKKPTASSRVPVKVDPNQAQDAVALLAMRS